MEQLTALERELLKASGGLGQQVQVLQKSLSSLAQDLRQIGQSVAALREDASASANASLKANLSAYEARMKAVEGSFRSLSEGLSVCVKSASEQHNSLRRALIGFDERLSALESSQNALTSALARKG